MEELIISTLKLYLAVLCFFNRHSPRLSHAPCTNLNVGEQIKKLGAHLRSVLRDTLESGSIEVLFFTYAHKTQPFLPLHVSPQGINFQTQSCTPLNFRLKSFYKNFANSMHKLLGFSTSFTFSVH